MKKILVCILLSMFLLTGCNGGYNVTLVDTAWKFNYADIDGIGTVEVESWLDFEDSDMIQVTAKNGCTYLTHSSKVILRTR